MVFVGKLAKKIKDIMAEFYDKPIPPPFLLTIQESITIKRDKFNYLIVISYV